MEILIALLALALVVVVIAVVGAPLRAAGRENRPENGKAARAAGREGLLREIEASDQRGVQAAEQRSELEAAREAKYREIRDVELDYRTGKLSPEDFAATDGALRVEAVEILDRLELLDRERPGGDG